MYGKIFESIFDSTLVAEGGWLPTYVFMSMVAIADKDGYVEIAPKVLYSKLGFRNYDSKIEYSDFETALNYLTEPDSYSKSTDFDGKRIIPISQLPEIEGARGWWIVNYEKYRSRAAREDRSSQSTERSRRWRSKKKANEINDETEGDALGRRGRHADTDTNKEKDKKEKSAQATLIKKDFKPTDRDYQLLTKNGIPQTFAENLLEEFIDYWVDVEGKKKTWRGTFRNHAKAQWERRPRNDGSSYEDFPE